ncbi:MAG: sigma-70 family RNA polymerase sigma factor [Pseudonocardia sp.]|nr:sigma-70 family RNA polymerase sigma factor [Pseudonocardia sp.]
MGGTDEHALVDALRRGDEKAFAELVDRHTPGLLRVARAHVRDAGTAEEVVQETWMALVTGIDRFEQLSSVKTWLYRVALYRSRRRRQRDSRPLSSLLQRDDGQGDDGPTVDPSRFRPDDAAQWPGHWSQPPRSWQCDPHVRLESAELMDALRAAIDALPVRQREVVVLRDVEGLTTGEVAATLGLLAGNVRVLLHRGRAKVRSAMEEHLR